MGKLQLDAREYAEARRIFYHAGSVLYPNDDQLRHHAKVWNAFHGSCSTEATSCMTSNSDCTSASDDSRKNHKEVPAVMAVKASSIVETPPVLQTPKDTIEELFLGLDVAVNAIPTAVKKFKGPIPSEQRTKLLYASKKPVLSKQGCAFLIQSAKDGIRTRGWTKDRHVQAPTCDIPLFDLPASACLWFRQSLHTTLLPLLCKTIATTLTIDPDQLHIQDCFIVRYDDDVDPSSSRPGFSSLKPHEDESLLSVTIALNDMDEYDGGGLYLPVIQID